MREKENKKKNSILIEQKIQKRIKKTINYITNYYSNIYYMNFRCCIKKAQVDAFFIDFLYGGIKEGRGSCDEHSLHFLRGHALDFFSFLFPVI